MLFLFDIHIYLQQSIVKYTIKNFCQPVKETDKIIAISKQTKSDIIKFFNIPENKIEVVYQGCNVIFQKSIPNDEKQEVISKYNLPQNFLLHVSSITERKNLLSILKSIHKLNNQHLVVIGDGKTYKKSFRIHPQTQTTKKSTLNK